MKGKIFIASLLAFSVTTNAFALEIYKGKVIKSKEWTTDSGIKAVYTNAKHSRLKPMDEGRDAVSQINFTEGAVGAPVTVNGGNFVYISNESEQTNTYHFQTSICAALTEHTDRCSYHFEDVSLEPGGYFMVDKENAMQLTFAEAGEYSSYIVTSVSDSGDNYITGTASSCNKILISANKKS